MSALDKGNSQFLRGANGQWHLNTFRIPIEKVRFPTAPGTAGTPPIPAENTVRIEVDTGNENSVWCTTIGWAALQIEATSPIVVVHGINSGPAFFNIFGFAGVLEANGLIVDRSIQLPPVSISENAKALSETIPGVATKYGVNSLHLVCHSKGGLDARDYMARFHAGLGAQFSILSVTTLSTPHQGSTLADLVVAYEEQVSRVGEVLFSGFPAFRLRLRDLTGMYSLNRSPGYRDLQTHAVAAFNSRNITALSGATIYSVVAADADRSGNEHMDNVPDEYGELRLVSPGLSAFYQANPEQARHVVDFTYQVLNNVASVDVNVSPDPTGGGEVASLDAVGAIPGGNDCLVSVESGRGSGAFRSLVSNEHLFYDAGGRNHSNVANAGVAQVVLPWLRTAEVASGDLKRR